MELRHVIEFAKFSPLGMVGAVAAGLLAWPTCTVPTYNFITHQSVGGTCSNHFGSFGADNLMLGVLGPALVGAAIGCAAAVALVYGFGASKDELING